MANKKDYDFYIVKGNSMLPTIEPNTKIKILKMQNIKLRIGDIIIFKRKSLKKIKSQRIIHRIVKISSY